MDKDQATGWAILAASLVGIAVYGYLLIISAIVVLQVTAFIAVAVILGILAWIGWTMGTTPPPEPISAETAPLVTEPATGASSTETKEHTRGESK